MFRTTSWPIDSGRRLTPITTTLRGNSSAATERCSAARSRAIITADSFSVGSMSKPSETTPSSMRCATL